MARGESESGGNGAAIAIWASFVVAALAAAYVVVQVTVGRDESTGPAGATEPHPGIEGPLRTLTSRGCDMATGPRAGGSGMPTFQDATDHLRRRGYERVRDFAAPEPLPATVDASELRGTCGVAVAVVEGGGTLDRGEGGGTAALPCDFGAVLVPLCDGGPVTFEGRGEARIGLFVMPRAVPDAALGADPLLAHAEAEALLAAAGWAPQPQALTASQSGGTLDALPTHPRGCVPWVVAGTGLGNASTQWLGRNVASDIAPDRLLAGVVVCDPSRTTTLTATPVAGASTFLVARPYRMSTGPSAPRAPSLTPVELLSAGTTIELPSPVHDRTAP